jgi:hypothetical protein
MGTVGGKIGLVAGIVAALLAIGPLTDLILGDCLFEQGCGPYETPGLVAVALASVVIGLAVGMLVRLASNRVLSGRR